MPHRAAASETLGGDGSVTTVDCNGNRLFEIVARSTIPRCPPESSLVHGAPAMPALNVTPLESSVERLLLSVPESWTPKADVVRTQADEEALLRLVAASLIERRFGMSLHFAGDPIGLEIEGSATGEGGLAELMQPVFAEMLSRWFERFQTLAREGRHQGCIRALPSRMDDCRLTLSGVEARAEFSKDQQGEIPGSGTPPRKMALDFVLRRDFFRFRPTTDSVGRLLSLRVVPASPSAPGEGARGDDTPASSPASQSALTLEAIRAMFRAELVPVFEALNGAAKPPPVGVPPDDQAPAALSNIESLVLVAMGKASPDRLLRVDQVIDLIDSEVPPSPTSVRAAITRLLEINLVERPEGSRMGSRLTRLGRRTSARLANESF